MRCVSRRRVRSWLVSATCRRAHVLRSRIYSEGASEGVGRARRDIIVFRLHRTMDPFPEVGRKLCRRRRRRRRRL